LLVRNGASEMLKKGTHTFYNVYTEMFYQICRDYNTLPDIRSLTAREIVFFYEGLRQELIEHTKPRG